MNKEPTDQNNTSYFLRSYECLWKDECERLKKQLSESIIISEWYRFSSAKKNTPFTSASRTSKSSDLLRNHEEKSDRKTLRKNILETSIPIGLARIF